MVPQPVGYVDCAARHLDVENDAAYRIHGRVLLFGGLDTRGPSAYALQRLQIGPANAQYPSALQRGPPPRDSGGLASSESART